MRSGRGGTCVFDEQLVRSSQRNIARRNAAQNFLSRVRPETPPPLRPPRNLRDLRVKNATALGRL